MGASPALTVEFAAILVDSRPRVRQEHDQKSQVGRMIGMGGRAAVHSSEADHRLAPGPIPLASLWKGR